MFSIGSTRAATILVLLLLASLPVSAQHPSTPDTELRERGIKLYESGDFVGAIKFLQRAVKQNKRDGIGWYHLGVALYRIDKNKEARKALETAVKLLPDDADAHTALAYAFLITNKLIEANREAKRAIALNEKNAAAHYVLGVVDLRTGEFGEAKKAADRALELEPNMPLALLLKSQVLVSMLSYASLGPDKKPFPDNRLVNSDYLLLKEAAGYLEQYVQLNPNDPNAKEWREQLETLRFYANVAVDEGKLIESGVLNPNDVTTKAIILSKPSPEYTESARQAQVSGTVVLQMVLASDGQVKHILVLRWLSHGLVNTAERAARQIKFRPAIRDGHPVSQFVRVEYNFNIY